MHRPALAFAIAGFFPKQFGKHQRNVGAFGQAMPVTAVGAGDVVIGAKGFARSDGDRFLADIEVGEAGHQGARVKVVHLVFEQANPEHLPIHTNPKVGVGLGRRIGSVYGC